MIVIPASVKRDKSDVKTERKRFLNHLILYVWKCVQTMSVDDTYEYLLEHHGIDWNRQRCVELAYRVDSYPEREQYWLNQITDQDLTYMVNGCGGSGIRFDVLDFFNTYNIAGEDEGG